jgi:hypothetical protein
VDSNWPFFFSETGDSYGERDRGRYKADLLSVLAFATGGAGTGTALRYVARNRTRDRWRSIGDCGSDSFAAVLRRLEGTTGLEIGGQ